MSRPKCPNHTVEMDRTDEPRVWICPISGARFEADSDDLSTEVRYDKYGRPLIDWKLTPLDGDGG